MMNFKEISKKIEREDGIQYKYYADNGYGASIIQTTGSYGSKQGLWELAVLDSNEQISYNTPITNDVLGYLTEEQVNETLKKINELK